MNRNFLTALKGLMVVLSASTASLLYLVPAKAQVNPSPTIFNEPPFNGDTGSSSQPDVGTPTPGTQTPMQMPTYPSTTPSDTTTPGMGSGMEMQTYPDSTTPDTTTPGSGTEMQPNPDITPDTNAPSSSPEMQTYPDANTPGNMTPGSGTEMQTYPDSTTPDTTTPGSGTEMQTYPDSTTPDTTTPDNGMEMLPNPDVTPDTNAPSSSPEMQTYPGANTPDTTTPGAGSEMQTPTTPDDGTQQQSSATITDIASSSDSFQTLTAALQATGLADELAGQGSFTVFAPTDEAFEALPPGIVEELMKPENREALSQILAYHVVSGTVLSADLTSGEVATEEGSPVMIQVGDNNEVMVNDASVIQPDIRASNGVIHAIDRVILPPDM